MAVDTSHCFLDVKFLGQPSFTSIIDSKTFTDFGFCHDDACLLRYALQVFTFILPSLLAFGRTI